MSCKSDLVIASVELSRKQVVVNERVWARGLGLGDQIRLGVLAVIRGSVTLREWLYFFWASVFSPIKWSFPKSFAVLKNH